MPQISVRQRLRIVWSTPRRRNAGSSLTLTEDTQNTERIKAGKIIKLYPNVHSSLHLSLKREGPWGTTDDFTTSFLRFSLFVTVLWDFANSRPVHSPMLSSHLFSCLPCLLPPFTVPCKMLFFGARPDERKTCPYHCSFRLFTMVRRSSLYWVQSVA